MKVIFRHPALSIPLLLTGQMEVCGQCNGQGTTFRGDLDENRLVELMEADGDEDGLVDYRGGHFDETCPECKGRNVVEAIDQKEFKANHPKEYKRVQSYERDFYESQRECAAERAYFGY